MAGNREGIAIRTTNPSPNPQDVMSSTTCRYFGSPRGLETSGIEEAVRGYRDYKEKSAGEYDLSESELNILGYQILYGDKNPQGAIQIFHLSSLEHPSPSNAFDSLAEAYQFARQKVLAKANYKKAIELD